MKLGLSTSLFLFLGAFASASECVRPLISGPPVFPPYIVAGENGVRTGLAIDKAFEILTPITGEPTLDISKPWSRVLKEFENGDIDILFVSLYNQERESFATFTDPWIQDEYGVVTLKGSQFSWDDISSLNDLYGGYYYGAYLPEPFGSFIKANPKTEGIATVESMYKMLSANRVEFLIVALQSFELLKPEGFSSHQFKIHEDSISSTPVHMVISNKSPCLNLLNEINDALTP
jgi:ABC-type amino acid transport substrate-binding protein